MRFGLRKGFTMLEMAVVIIIVGVIIVFSAGLTRSLSFIIQGNQIKKDADYMILILKEQMSLHRRPPTNAEFTALVKQEKFSEYKAPGGTGFKYVVSSDVAEKKVFFNYCGVTNKQVVNIALTGNSEVNVNYVFYVEYWLKGKVVYRNAVSFVEFESILGCKFLDAPVILTERLPNFVANMSYLASVLVSPQYKHYCILVDNRTDAANATKIAQALREPSQTGKNYNHVYPGSYDGTKVSGCDGNYFEIKDSTVVLRANRVASDWRATDIWVCVSKNTDYYDTNRVYSCRKLRLE